MYGITLFSNGSSQSTDQLQTWDLSLRPRVLIGPFSQHQTHAILHSNVMVIQQLLNVCHQNEKVSSPYCPWSALDAAMKFSWEACPTLESIEVSKEAQWLGHSGKTLLYKQELIRVSRCCRKLLSRTHILLMHHELQIVHNRDRHMLAAGDSNI